MIILIERKIDPLLLDHLHVAQGYYITAGERTK